MRSFVVLFFLSFNLVSQNETNEISNSLKSFFENNNTVLHCHLNKTTFLPGEEIWFAVYAFNKNNSTIQAKNSNGQISLYSFDNKRISEQLIYIKNGKTFGNILLPKETKPGSYYIRVTTAGINSLDTDEAFYKHIQIIGKNKFLQKKKVLNYDIQILPEGGQLIENIKSTCGFKILNQLGKGERFENLKLIDDKNNLVLENISTNNFGMGAFIFTPQKNKFYYLKHPSIKKTKLPLAQEKGIALNLKQNYANDNIKITLSTNINNLFNLENKEITVIIHKNDLSKIYTTSFKKGVSQLLIDIPNKELFLGVNTVTVLFKNKPILERIFFNNKTIKKITSTIKVLETKQDSSSLLISNNSNGKIISSNISISVLSKKNIANKNRSNIYNSVFLKPFINGTVENSDYYFSEINKEKKYNLDLLLLNQGWRKYHWNKIFNTPKIKQLKKPITSGISIKGYIRTLNSKDIPTHVLLHSKKNQELSIVPIYDSIKFHFQNLNLKLKSFIDFSALNYKGKPIMANFFFITEPTNNDFRNRHNNPLTNPDFYVNEKKYSFPKGEGTTLDEVVVKANKLRFSKYTKGRFGVKIDSSHYGFTTIENYFKFKEHLQLKYFGGSRKILPGYYWVYRNGQIARFLVNGKPATYMNGLLNYPMQNVLEVYFGGRDGFGRRRNHIIFTNGKEKELPKHLKTSKKIQLKKNGFNTKKEFYKPFFEDLNDDFFLKYSSIYWLPEIITLKNNFKEFKIPSPISTDLIFYIEGYSENGLPISIISELKNLK